MSKNKLTFAEAMAWMFANPGKCIQCPQDEIIKYVDGDYFWYDKDDDEWNLVSSFESVDISGQWTIPEPEIPEVEVEVYQNFYGNIVFVRKDSRDDKNFKKNDHFTKCKIKFNQG